MKLVATYHHPTSVSHSLKCVLTNNTSREFLVVAKTNSLQVFSLLPEGLRLECSQEIWGRITSLQSIPNTSGKSKLLVTTDHPEPRLFLIEYVHSTKPSGSRLLFSRSESLYESGARPTEFFTGAIVDAQGEVAVVSSYKGKLRILQFGGGAMESDFDASIRELNVLSMCFLISPSYSSKVLAILHRDHTENIVLVSRDVSVADSEISTSPSQIFADVIIRDLDACLLAAVPPDAERSWNRSGGVLVFGGLNILFYASSAVEQKQKKRKASTVMLDDLDFKNKRKRKADAQVDWPFSEIKAWSQIDHQGRRFLLGDSFGRLALLAISLDAPKLQLISLGQVSPPTSLTLLSSQYIFLGSHFGDSQLLRILPDRSSSQGSYVDVVDQFKNIAPILDAIVADTDGSGQSQIVTCSGGKNTGSLRVIRSGTTFHATAVAEGLPAYRNIWPLKSRYYDKFHSYFLASTATETHLYGLPSIEVNELTRLPESEFAGLTFQARTICASNQVKRTTSGGKSAYEDSPFVIQITPDAVVLANMHLGIAEDRWTPDGAQEIVAADISPSQICVGLAGGGLVLLIINGDKISPKACKELTTANRGPAQISAISIASLDSTKLYANWIAVGFWDSNHVQIYDIPNLEAKGSPIQLTYLPRSVLLRNFGDSTNPQIYLLISQGDGTVAVLPFSSGVIGNKKVVQLGEVPVMMTACLVNNRPMVFAGGNQSAIFFWEKESLKHSPVLLKDVSAATHMNAEFSPTSLMLVTPSGLCIGRVQDFDKLHIRTVPMGLDNPGRIAYLSESRVFGVGCVRTEPSRQDEAEHVSSYFKLLDDISFETLYTHRLEAGEEVTAVDTVVLDLNKISSSYIAVGSMFYEEGRADPAKGQIRIFSCSRPSADSHDFTSFLSASVQTRGCVHATVGIQGKLAAAINTSIILYGLEASTPNVSETLVKLAEWNHNYFVTSLVSRGDMLITGDAISSVAVLQLVDGSFRTVARDYGPLWPLCVGMFDDRTIVGANSESNLFSFKLQHQENNKMKLEPDGSFHVGDNVNKFLSSSLSIERDDGPFHGKQIFFTASGRIGTIIDLDDGISRSMIELQRNLAGVIFGPGNMDHNNWRAPINARGRSDAHPTAVGFLDGDFLENFLSLSSSSVEVHKVITGKSEPERLKLTYHQIRSLLESLQEMH